MFVSSKDSTFTYSSPCKSCQMNWLSKLHKKNNKPWKPAHLSNKTDCRPDLRIQPAAGVGTRLRRALLFQAGESGGAWALPFFRSAGKGPFTAPGLPQQWGNNGAVTGNRNVFKPQHFIILYRPILLQMSGQECPHYVWIHKMSCEVYHHTTLNLVTIHPRSSWLNWHSLNKWTGIYPLLGSSHFSKQPIKFADRPVNKLTIKILEEVKYLLLHHLHHQRTV